MHKKFASLSHPEKYGYLYGSESWTSGAQICSYFRMFQTCGDGLTQHSGDWPITAEFFGDYLASLAAAMAEDSELCRRLWSTLDNKPRPEVIAFCASVIYKAPEAGKSHKRRYFSVELGKISADENKKHDKRYQEVTDVHDGSTRAIFRMLLPEYARGLEQLVYAEAIRDWGNDQTPGKYMELSGVFLGWFKDCADQHRRAQSLHSAYVCAWAYGEAYRTRENAKCHLECYRHNYGPKPPAPEEIEEATPAPAPMTATEQGAA